MLARLLAPAWAAFFAAAILAADERFDPHKFASISNHVQQPRFARAAWGVKVVDAQSGATLLDINAAKLMKPASVAKLFTAAAALDQLSASHRISTTLHSDAPPRNGRVQGPLRIYGRGDPSLDSRILTNPPTLRALAESLRKKGVRRIDGAVVIDTSFFDAIPYGTGWTWDDTHYGYGPKVTALNYAENVALLEITPAAEPNLRCLIRELDIPFPYKIKNFTRTAAGNGMELLRATPPDEEVLTVYGALAPGSSPVTLRAPIHSPERAVAQALLRELKRARIRCGDKVEFHSRSPRSEDTLGLDHMFELAAVQSPPLSELLPVILKNSDNLYAQALFLHLGRAAWRDSAWTIEEAAAARVKELVEAMGADSGDLLLDDGTGLSRSTLVTPGAVAALLLEMRSHREHEVFANSLPEPGEGTLRNRLLHHTGRLRAKTGSIRHVNTLAGYATLRGGAEVVFAIMLNNYSPAPNDRSGREEIDAVVNLLLER